MKFVIFIGFVLFMIDPCHVEPRKLELSEVDSFCRSEHPTKYVKLQGRLSDKGDVICRDMPGGVHCEVFLGETGSGQIEARAFISGGVDNPDLARRGRITFPVRKDWNGIEPINVAFRDITLFDSDGVRIDHLTEDVELAGTLRFDAEKKHCGLYNLQRVRRVE